MQTNGTGGWTLSACGSGSSGSAKVVYVSKLASIPATTAVVPGSSASGTTDASSIINAAIAGGNVDLEVDGGYALSTSLVLSSNTTIHCTSPQFGFIMQTAANTPVLINAHTNAPTTTNSTGGYLVSNIGDTDIMVRGCTLNANSTQAVTGSNPFGVNHSVTPGGSPTAKYVGGVEFYAVNGLVLDHDECYDSGSWCIFGSNDENVYVTNNYLHQPIPMVHEKATAGYQFDGPDQFIFANGNRINAGDDSIAYNADDGQIPGSGDANATYIKSFVKWGNITDVQDSNETFDCQSTDSTNCDFFGVRLLSTNDLIDRINFKNIQGGLCGNTATLIAAYPGVGPGNLGTISFDGWKVTTNGQCNDFSFPYNFNISQNIQNLQISNLQITNPGVNWPIITQTTGTIGNLSLRNWDLNTQTSGFSNVVSATGGTIGQLAASGINWNDNPSNSSSFFSGSVVPGIISVSNYSGPNRLLASGYSPAIKNGDAFTNTYPSVAVTYVNTTFTEHTSGAVATTTPATCANGCTGAWTASSGGPSGTGVLTYGTNLASITGGCTSGGADVYCPVTINPGHANYTMRVTMSAMPLLGGFGFAVRWTDQNNFVTWVEDAANTWALCDVVSGTTSCGSNQTLTAAPDTYTIVVTGTSVSLSNSAGTISGTISGSNTGGGAGINNSQSGTITTTTMTAFSLKSF